MRYRGGRGEEGREEKGDTHNESVAVLVEGADEATLETSDLGVAPLTDMVEMTEMDHQKRWDGSIERDSGRE